MIFIYLANSNWSKFINFSVKKPMNMLLIDKKLYHITAAANTCINFSMRYEYYYVIPEEGIICNDVKREFR